MSIFRGMSNQSWPTIIVLAVLTVLVVLLTWMLCFDDTAHADGWSSDIWPSQEYPMEGWRQLNECYSSTVERCIATGVALPSAATNMIAARSTLVSMKAQLNTAIQSFVNTNLLDQTTPVASNYCASATNLNVPVWSVTGLLSYLRMPTNFFAFTPYLGFSGLGPFTNDTSTAYPHGYTNSFTINGGTNFPSGRSAWYDTDYGIAGWTNLMAPLLWTRKTASAIATNTCQGYWEYDGFPHTWAYMQSKAELSYPTNSIQDYVEGLSRYNYWLQIGTFGAYYYIASPLLIRNMSSGAERFQWSIQVSGLSTVYEHSCEFYVKADMTLIDNVAPYSPQGTTEWDDNGDPVVSNVYNYIEASAATFDSNVMSSVVGSTNFPTWCADPLTVATGTDNVKRSQRGYTLSAATALVRWDSTNGFQFK